MRSSDRRAHTIVRAERHRRTDLQDVVKRPVRAEQDAVARASGSRRPTPRAVAGSSVSRSRTSSTPRNKPDPRTSPISGCSSASARSRRAARRRRRARAPAAAPRAPRRARRARPRTTTVLPPKVLKNSIPLSNDSAISGVVTTAPSGCPLPIGLPRTTMSGTTPCVSNAQKCVPKRPKARLHLVGDADAAGGADDARRPSAR